MKLIHLLLVSIVALFALDFSPYSVQANPIFSSYSYSHKGKGKGKHKSKGGGYGDHHGGGYGHDDHGGYGDNSGYDDDDSFSKKIKDKWDGMKSWFSSYSYKSKGKGKGGHKKGKGGYRGGSGHGGQYRDFHDDFHHFGDFGDFHHDSGYHRSGGFADYSDYGDTGFGPSDFGSGYSKGQMYGGQPRTNSGYEKNRGSYREICHPIDYGQSDKSYHSQRK